MPGPLDGIVVLDLTRVLAGPGPRSCLPTTAPRCIKVESPAERRRHASLGSAVAARRVGRAKPRSPRTTRRPIAASASIAIDLATTEGRRLVRRLAAGADVFDRELQGRRSRERSVWRTAICEPLNAAADLPVDLRVWPGRAARRRAGLRRDDPGIGGLMSITGVPDGEPGAGPQKVGVAVADLMCGMYAATAILGALHERHAPDRGQYIDLALLDSQVAWLANQALNYLVSGQVPERRGTAHPNIVPYQAFATADGHLMLAVGNDAQFAGSALSPASTRARSDARFASNARAWRIASGAGVDRRRAVALPDARRRVARGPACRRRALRADQRPGAGVRRSHRSCIAGCGSTCRIRRRECTRRA